MIIDRIIGKPRQFILLDLGGGGSVFKPEHGSAEGYLYGPL